MRASAAPPHAYRRCTALALLLCASCASAVRVPLADSASAPQADPGLLAEPLVQLLGRWVPGPQGNSSLGSLPQTMTWGAVTATVAFKGATAVTLRINGSLGTWMPSEAAATAYVLNGVGPMPWSRFRLTMDGQTVGERETTATTPLLNWSVNGLEPGEHVLSLAKLTEARHGGAVLESIELEGEGAGFLPPAPSPGQQTGRRIVILGDSFSAGAGNLANASCAYMDAAAQDMLATYGPLVARNFSADYEHLAWSGSGMVWCPNRPGLPMDDAKCNYRPGLPAIWRRLSALDPDSIIGMDALREYDPQVVLLAGGINEVPGGGIAADHHITAGGPSHSPENATALLGRDAVDRWLLDYELFIRELQASYPSATIIQVIWPLEALLVGIKDPIMVSVYLQFMAATQTHLKMMDVVNVHQLQLRGERMDTRDWCRQHPRAVDAENVAEQLVHFINALDIYDPPGTSKADPFY